jgi:translocation and assembly module TamB
MTDYVSGKDQRQGYPHRQRASLQSTGTRGAHTISAAARGDSFDANLRCTAAGAAMPGAAA